MEDRIYHRLHPGRLLILPSLTFKNLSLCHPTTTLLRATRLPTSTPHQVPLQLWFSMINDTERAPLRVLALLVS